MHTTSPNTLVSSSEVDGTEVYSRNGDEIGHVDHIMIDKKSGTVAYAVMHFGGFLGFGEDTHHVPWKKLDYDVSKGGYVTDITEEQLKGAPARASDWSTNRDWEQRTHEYYRVPPYWGL